MSKEVAKREETALAAPAGETVAPRVSASDILIPRLSLQQAMSDAVTARKAAPGDFVRSTDGKVFDSEVEIIPITFTKTWIIKKARKANDSRGEFVASEPFKEGDEMKPLNWEEDRVPHWRDLQFNLFGLLVEDVKKDIDAFKKFEETGELPTADESAMPVVCTFQRSSYKVGKVFATYFAQCQDVGERCGRYIPPYGCTFKLGRTLIEKEDSWYVWEATRSGKADDEAQKVAARWAKILSSAASVKVDEEDPEPSTPKQANPVPKSSDDIPHPGDQRQF